LYHRFGNRNGILAAAWIRALERFQLDAMAAQGETALETAVAMAVSAVRFARESPQDARLLVMLRPSDLLDGEPDAAFRETLANMNAPLVRRGRDLARQLYGGTDKRTVDVVNRAVADLPYAIVRRHVHDAAMPGWLEADVAVDVRALLMAHDHRSSRRSR